MNQSAQAKPEAITRLEDAAGLQKTGLFDTHPSNGDRIREARRANAPGLFNGDGPATGLFANFEAVSKQVTLLHYNEDLGIHLAMAHLMPVASAEPARE